MLSTELGAGAAKVGLGGRGEVKKFELNPRACEGTVQMAYLHPTFPLQCDPPKSTMETQSLDLSSEQTAVNTAGYQSPTGKS